MRLDRRFVWLGLFAAGIWLSVIEADRPPARAPLHPMSIRITVEADGAMRVEAPDGTDVSLPSPPLDNPTLADEILFRLRDELTRLDPAADPDRLFEIVSDPGISFRRLLWILQCTYPLRVLPTQRRFVFSLLADRSVTVTIVHVAPPRYQDRALVSGADIRLLGRASVRGDEAAVRAAVSVGTRFADGPPHDFEASDWSPIEPRHEVVRDWLLRLKRESGDWHGALSFAQSDYSVPYGVVFEVMRGFGDAGVPFDFYVDSKR